jgi:Leu/Phe-tRNA-protein transferase
MIHSLISWELTVSQKRMKKGVRKDWDVSSDCDVEEEVEQCHLQAARRNRLGINKVAYIVYKEWLDHALTNEIKETNYDVNVLWKENIACLWVLENNFVL